MGAEDSIKEGSLSKGTKRRAVKTFQCVGARVQAMQTVRDEAGERLAVSDHGVPCVICQELRF